jgi:hypothetical protein
MESKCVLFVIESMEVCPQLVRGKVTGASSEDFWSEYLDKYCQRILDHFLDRAKALQQ